MEKTMEKKGLLKGNKKIIIAIVALIIVIVSISFIKIHNNSALFYKINWNSDMKKAERVLARKAGRNNLLVEEEDQVITVFKNNYLGYANLNARMQYFFTKDSLSFISIYVIPLDGDKSAAHEILEEKIEAYNGVENFEYTFDNSRYGDSGIGMIVSID